MCYNYSVNFIIGIDWGEIMKLKKCPMCKMRVPAMVDVCPVCETKYSKFQYFKINYLSKCILVLLAVFFVYNSVVIITYNRKIRSYINEPPKNIEQVEKLRNGYERLNFIQKYFVHSSEIEIIENSMIDEKDIVRVEGKSLSIYFEKGSREGTYSGEMYENMPDGKGMFTYYLDDGTICSYDGDFDDGTMTGFGIMTFSDGRKYAGEFKDGMLDGFAVMYNSDGYMIKKGKFVAGELNGIATIYDDYGLEIYSGRFISGIPTEREYKDSCQDATFAELEADADAYVNKNLCIKGVITDIAIQEDMTVMYIINIAGNSHKNVCIEYIGNRGQNIREGDSMEFYGYFAGYRSFINNNGQKNGGMIIKTYYVN